MFRQFLLLCFYFYFSVAHADDLMLTFKKAQRSDPTFQRMISENAALKENTHLAWSRLLPSLDAQFNPSLTHSRFSGSNLSIVDGEPLTPKDSLTRAYGMGLNLNQPIFDFGLLMNLKGAYALNKLANATLNAALQDLIIRVANSYFDILKDEENLLFSAFTKEAFKEQLNQTRQQVDVGLKTRTDINIAEAAYDAAIASMIAAQNKLADDRENLRTITGEYPHHLLPLSENFPLVTPKPAQIERWVARCRAENWSIKAARFRVENTLQQLRGHYGGHLPIIHLNATLEKQFSHQSDHSNSILDRNGAATRVDRAIGLTINLPIFAGGQVLANTHQARYVYEAAQQSLEETIRRAINLTRQSYLGIIAGRSQIKADKKAIQSALNSVEGMKASFDVGTETLLNVLNQRQKLFEAQTHYANDRYQFVKEILQLKQAAGVLSLADLQSINVWLEKRISKNGIKLDLPLTNL